VSNEAVCVITGLIPINIQIAEIVMYYEYIKGNVNLFDQEMEVKHWTHQANCFKIIEGQEDSKYAIHVYSDGSKCDYGVGSGIAILSDSNLIR
jgi:hypothetical protein